MLTISEIFEFSSENPWILKEFWPNSDVKSSNGSIPRRSNLSTQVEAVAVREAPDTQGGPGAEAVARRLGRHVDEGANLEVDGPLEDIGESGIVRGGARARVDPLETSLRTPVNNFE